MEELHKEHSCNLHLESPVVNILPVFSTSITPLFICPFCLSAYPPIHISPIHKGIFLYNQKAVITSEKIYMNSVLLIDYVYFSLVPYYYSYFLFPAQVSVKGYSLHLVVIPL